MRCCALAVLLLTTLTRATSQIGAGPSFVPNNGFVPDAATAVKIGEAVLTPVYGERVVASERPFKAILKGSVWVVEGTLHCDGAPICPGGVAVVKISKSSGRILHMAHYQ